MSKTGGGKGTNQHRIKGTGKTPRDTGGAADPTAEGQASEAVFDPINQPYGATPVDEEDRQFLLPRHRGIETMAALNSLESENIGRALLWVRTEAFDAEALLDQYTLREVHRRMFGDVWEWAGRLRTRETSIGIDPGHIQERWKAALDDAAYWIENRTWSPAGVILRLHHRTVQIHPFVNGNGRHARLMAEELAVALELGDDFLTWGSHFQAPHGEIRRRYLDALRAMDRSRNDVEPLIELALGPDALDEWS